RRDGDESHDEARCDGLFRVRGSAHASSEHERADDGRVSPLPKRRRLVPAPPDPEHQQGSGNEKTGTHLEERGKTFERELYRQVSRSPDEPRRGKAGENQRGKPATCSSWKIGWQDARTRASTERPARREPAGRGSPAAAFA